MMKSTDFIKKLKDTADNYNTIYALGMFGQPITKEIINQKATQKGLESWYTKNRAKLEAVVGKGYFGFDCICLPKGILWGWTGNADNANGGAKYCSNGVDDVGADEVINICSEVSTDFSNIIAGEIVWMKGHVGIYIGEGKVIECTPKWTNNVQYSNLGNISKYKSGNYRIWTKHGKLPWIEYVKAEKQDNPKMITITLPELKKGMGKDDSYVNNVKAMQALLVLNNYDIGSSGIDGSFGNATEKAVKKLQEDMKQPQSGWCGPNTWKKLLGN